METYILKENVLTATFNRGKIENGDGSVGPDLVGPATNYKFEGTGITSPINQTNNNDLTVDLSTNKFEIHKKHSENWKISLIDTGSLVSFDSKTTAA